MIVTEIIYITSFTAQCADIGKCHAGFRCSQEQAEPREPPEGMIKPTPYTYLRFWLCLWGDRTQTNMAENNMKGTTKPKGIGIAATVLLAALLIAAAIVPAVGASTPASESVRMDNEERPVLEFEGFTRMMVSGANTKSELGDQGITEPEELTIPISVKRFDLVTFNVADLRNQIRNGSVPLRIKGNSYDAELKRMEFDIQSVDNGIYSYKGTLKGVNDSKILLTISSRVVIAEVTIGDESIWVKPVEPRRRAKEGKPGLHIVYSSKDTELPTRHGKIDNGPVRLPNQTSTEEIRDLETLVRGSTTPIELLVATDNKFYEDEDDWEATAQGIIAEANNQFNRDDIDLHLFVVDYDESKRHDLSNDPDIKSEPLDTFKKHFPSSYLNSKSADLAIYLGGYDADGNCHGEAWSYPGGRHAWAQMVKDWYAGGWTYDGSPHGRRVTTIHELGHNFDADHQGSGGYNQAYDWWSWWNHYYTVMWGAYKGSNHKYEFSSDDYHGDSTHDNVRRISEIKGIVANYNT